MKFWHHDQMLLSTIYTGNGPICIYNYVPGMQYEGRGRVVQEVKVISGSGTFRTEWWYNSADLVAWMKYPSKNQGGITPQVDTTYHPQKLVNSVASTTTYVKSTSYDAAGRVDIRLLGDSGGNAILRSDYDYFAWNDNNGNGRLKRIKSDDLSPVVTPLQDLRYYNTNTGASFYDAVGNLMYIDDYQAGSPQTQTFTYNDGLNRLTSAAASGGSGGIYNTETYGYDATTGNLSSKAGVGYAYSLPTSPQTTFPAHAVKWVNLPGSGSTSKQITVRAKGNYVASAWPQMKLFVNAQERCTWTVSTSYYANYTCNTQLTGRDQVDVVYTNDYNAGGLDRDLFVDYVEFYGYTAYQAEGPMVIDRGSGNAAFDGADVIPGQEELDLNGALRMVITPDTSGSAYGYDQNGNRSYWLKEGQAHVYTHDAENRLIEVKQNGSLLMSFFYDGDGQRVKSTLVGSPANTTTYYIGNHTEYETQALITTLRRYFYAGSTRVAMRLVDGATNPTYWLLNDHLGSTAITADASGALSAELRFKAWGEQRYASGSTPTTYRYTGQREQSQLSIYFYGARWYDPDLSRFLSPDTIIPGAGDSQAWDRFAYSLNNPIKYIDPDGHAPRCPGDLGCSYTYDPSESVSEAWGIVRDWFFNTGSEEQYFYETSSLTQDVMHDQGMTEFRKAWAEAGYKVPFDYNHQADQRSTGALPIRLINGGLIFAREHILELGLATIGLHSNKPEGRIDAIGGTIGSLDSISVREYRKNQVRIEVTNTTGWASAIRIPGTNISVISDRKRSETRFGGTIIQYYRWIERRPNLKKMDKK